MKSVKTTVNLGKCDPLNKCKVVHEASAEAVANKKAVTVLTYLHGVKEAQTAIADIQAEGYDIDLIELRCLKPLDLDTIRTSLERTNKCAILDESTNSGGVGADHLLHRSREVLQSPRRPGEPHLHGRRTSAVQRLHGEG